MAPAMPALAAGPAGARRLVEDLEISRIREVASVGDDMEDVLAFWYGEPDQPTPDFICQAAARAMAEGETFYTPNRGIAPLRRTLAGYLTNLYGLAERPVNEDRITVTASAMAALNLTQQIMIDAGDNAVIVGPLWPNLIQNVRTMGGEARIVALRHGNDGWRLDLEELFDRVDGRTRAILINSPGNPTGWMMTREEQQAVLDFCRERGLWLISDEVYARMVYDRRAAPSLLELAEPDERVVVVNSFSKTWCMTGWRLGWLTTPPALGEVLEKMLEFHHSCVPAFSQKAGIVAIEEGEAFVAEILERYRRARDIAIDRLQAMPRVRVTRPEAAFYAFFAVEGMTDSVATCKDILRRTGVGLAPGAAFGEEGEGWIRLCFASSEERLRDGLDRLANYLERTA